MTTKNVPVSSPSGGGISIIVPAYNAARYLPFTVESVLGQTVSGWELLLVDDGSTDDTLAVAQRYAQQDARIRVVPQANAGVSVARNNGLAASNAAFPYVAFLDADDCYKPDALQTLRAALEADEHAIGAHALAEFIDENGEPSRKGLLEAMCRQRSKYADKRMQFSSPTEPTTFAQIITGNCIPTPGVTLLRRSRLNMNPLFNPALKGPEDWDLYIRLLRHGHFVFVDYVVLGYRKTTGSLSSNKQRMRRVLRDMWRAALRSPENTPEQQEITRSCFRASRLFESQLRLRYAADALRERNLKNTFYQLAYGSKYLLDYVRGQP